MHQNFVCWKAIISSLSCKRQRSALLLLCILWDVLRVRINECVDKLQGFLWGNLWCLNFVVRQPALWQRHASTLAKFLGKLECQCIRKWVVCLMHQCLRILRLSVSQFVYPSFFQPVWQSFNPLLSQSLSYSLSQSLSQSISHSDSLSVSLLISESVSQSRSFVDWSHIRSFAQTLSQ